MKTVQKETQCWYKKIFCDLTNDTKMSDTKPKSKKISDQASIKHCSLCPGTTEYYCHDCKGDLCRPCKEMHVDILDIKYHDGTVYRGKLKYSLKPEMCHEHPDHACEWYWVTCDRHVCKNKDNNKYFIYVIKYGLIFVLRG